MTRLALLVLALSVGAVGCGPDTAASSADYARGFTRVRVVHVRACDYVVLESGYQSGGAITHAADCPNPAHQVRPMSATVRMDTDTIRHNVVRYAR